MEEKLIALKGAFIDVMSVCDWEKEFGDKYPFGKNFCEIVDDVIAWVDDEVGEEAKP